MRVRIGEILELRIERKHQRCVLIVDQDFRSKSYRISTEQLG